MKRFGAFAAVLMLAVLLAALSLPAMARAAGGADGACLDNRMSSSDGAYTSEEFTCPSGGGDRLRVFYREENGDPVKVFLQEKDSANQFLDVADMEVPAHGTAHMTHSAPGGKTFRIIVQSVNGGGVKGYLRARQLEGEYIIKNQTLRDGRLLFSTTEEAPYFRAAVFNPSDCAIVMQVSRTKGGAEEKIAVVPVEPGEWGATEVLHGAAQDFVIRLTAPGGHTPEGSVSVRISAETFR